MGERGQGSEGAKEENGRKRRRGGGATERTKKMNIDFGFKI
jgi:hypothetical protein